MSGPPSAFDWTLALALPALSLYALASRNLVRAVALFVALGLVLALTWAKLGAPDVALAEAALGSGITGVLLVSALGRLGRVDVRPPKGPLRSAFGGVLAAAATAGTFLFLLAPTFGEPAGLRDTVLPRVGETGASHPVTAVLLDFRGYDTLLEIAVLLLAVLGVRAAHGVARTVEAPPGPILAEGMKTIAPVIVLVAGYVLWAGTSAPGGAFQAGTALGAGAVLAALSGAFGQRPGREWASRVLLAAGYTVFVGVAAGTLAARGALLDYPPGSAGALLLAIETGLTITIAIVIRELFEGCSPPPRSDA